MNFVGWIAIGITLVLIVGIAYWQLVIAEGTYLGQHVVTWLYDLTAARYDRIKGFDEDFEALFLGQPLADLLLPQSDPLVLDVGTGTGRLPLALLGQRSFAGTIIGVDDSRPMLAKAREKIHQACVWLIWRNALSLPFIDAAFDVVACLEMLEFTPAPEQQLAEAVRVLRPGGVLVTTRRRGLDARLMPGKTYSKSEMQDVLSKLGMVNIGIEPWQLDYDLVWAIRAGDPERGYAMLPEVLRCPHCQAVGMIDRTEALLCATCGAVWPIRGGILEMRM
jgi:ubiquinone/menaquinone biosynthesis C-methylase UbiE